MEWTLQAWPAWLTRALVSLAIVVVAYGFGHLVRVTALKRLDRIASRTSGSFDNILIDEVKGRVPLWCTLIGVWLALGRWPLDAQASRLASSFVFVAGGASITFAASAVAGRLLQAYGQRITPSVPVSGLTQSLVSLLVIVLGALIVLNGLGVSITPLLTALGVGGLAVALALQEPLSNLFAGLFVTLAGQVRVGDYVRVEAGIEGFVTDFSWRSTRIRMLQNNLILVPNSKLAQSVLINYSLPGADLAVLVDVGVAYGSRLAHVERVTSAVARDVMREVQGGVPDFEPFIRFHTFSESSINFTVILRAKEYVDQYLVKHEFIKRLHERYDVEGIAIPFPMRTLTVQDALPVRVLSAAGAASRP